MEPLTAREREVLQLVAQGLTSNQIGTRLSITGRTVRTHVQHAMAKLGVKSRAQAVARAMQKGLID